METTENDALIAQILAEDYEKQSRKRLRSDSCDSPKRMKTDQAQIDEDFELAIQLYIEELARSENNLTE